MAMIESAHLPAVSAAALSGTGSGSTERGRAPRHLAKKRQKNWRYARGHPPVSASSRAKAARGDAPVRPILRFSRSPCCDPCFTDV